MKKFWERLSYIGIKQDMMFETKRRIVLLNRIAFSLFVIVFTLRTVVILLGFQDFSIQSMIPYLGMLLILSIPYVNKLGYYKINAFVFCLIVPLSFLFFSVLSQRSNEVIHINHYFIPRIFIMSTIVLPLVLIAYRDKFLFYAAIIFNLICLLLFDYLVQVLGVPLNPETVELNNYESISKIMILPSLLMVLAFAFMANLNRKYERQIMTLNNDLQFKNNELGKINDEVVAQRDLINSKNELLEEAHHKVEKINKELTDSILYAEDIQRSVLKDEEIPPGYFSEGFIFFKPKIHVSGDFYFYKEYQIDGKACQVVIVADCTGHGVPGGFLSMVGISHINEILQNEQISNAADVLNLLREKIKETLNQTGKFIEQKDGMDMAMTIYYPNEKIMDYAGAHIPITVITAEGEVKTIKGDRQPIAIYLREKKFTNHRLNFNGGEMVYLFSDGFHDQFGGAEGKKLKFSNLQNKLQDIAPLSCEKQKHALEFFLHDWMFKFEPKGQLQIDDITLIGLRI